MPNLSPNHSDPKAVTTKAAAPLDLSHQQGEAPIELDAGLAPVGSPRPVSPSPSVRGPGRNARFLVIVESPSKAKTITSYLGTDYKVLATLGHVRDLPVSPKETRFGVDTKTWTPEYVVSESKANAIHAFVEAAKKVEKVYIASDPDREGEAIAWHVEELLKEAGVDPNKISRATWGAITPEDIKAGLLKARPIDTDMVKSQEARRILDRVVGYSLSPWLMRQTGLKGLSAGRVQSAALKAVVERDLERENHIPIAYGAVSMMAEAGGKAFKATLTKAGGLQVVGPDKEGKPGTVMLKTAEMAALVLPKKGDQLSIISAETKPGKTAPKPPFTTTTMTVAASNSLGLATEAAMKIAQKLYEAGLISYHRSDSPMISEGAIQMARAHVTKTFGDGLLPTEGRQYHASGDHAQEGHECIRPTHLEPSHAALRAKSLAAIVATEGPLAAKLYDLIERRFVASQMRDKEYDSTVCHLAFGAGDKELVFKTNGNVTKVDGWTKVYAEDEGEEAAPAKDAVAVLPPLVKGGTALATKCDSTTKKTTPKPAFTEASMIQELEKLSIGRPSTYAAIFSTIRSRGYIESANEGARKNVLTSTPVGRQVIAKLQAEFPMEMDFAYTALMETNLDQIAHGKLKQEAFLDQSYGDLKAHF